jgi:hypothetical protein
VKYRETEVTDRERDVQVRPANVETREKEAEQRESNNDAKEYNLSLYEADIDREDYNRKLAYLNGRPIHIKGNVFDDCGSVIDKLVEGFDRRFRLNELGVVCGAKGDV